MQCSKQRLHSTTLVRAEGRDSPFAERNFMETSVRWPLTSIRLDICRPDNLAPLFGFVVDQLPEIGRRARKYHAAQVG